MSEATLTWDDNLFGYLEKVRGFPLLSEPEERDLATCLEPPCQSGLVDAQEIASLLGGGRSPACAVSPVPI